MLILLKAIVFKFLIHDKRLIFANAKIRNTHMYQIQQENAELDLSQVSFTSKPVI